MGSATPRLCRAAGRRLVVAAALVAAVAGATSVIAAGAWSATGSMTTGHTHHTASLLTDGRVLVAAGYGPPGASISSSSDVYNPPRSWSASGQLNFGRTDHAAARLADGRVLVAGGADDFSILSSAELWNPATGTWSLTGRLNFARAQHTATLLPSGKVLVAGGYANAATAELFDPAI